MRNFNKISNYIDIVFYQAYAELHAETTRAYLGVIWWILEPLLYMFVFYFVFGILLERGGPGFIPFLLCGLVSWKWFSSCVMRASECIPSNSNLIQKVYFPKYLLPLIVMTTNTIKFLIVFILLLLFLVFAFDFEVGISWLYLPIIIVIQFSLNFAIAGFFAAITPIIPDIKMVLSNGITLVFFVSGVFFDINKIPDEMRSLIVLNPMASMIDCYRTILLNNSIPDWKILLILTFSSLAILFISLFILNKYDRIYPKIALK